MEVSKDALQIKTLPTEKKYSDVRALTFSLPALDVESVFEYQTTTKKTRSLIEKKWFHSFAFNHLLYGIARIDPVFKSRLTLKVPKGEKFIFQLENTKISHTIKKQKKFVIYSWEVGNIPAMPTEIGMPSFSERITGVRMSSLQAWNEVDAWASRLIFPKIEVTQEVKARALQLTFEAKTREEKSEALFYFVENTIEYVAADLWRGGYTPHSVNEILKNQYGDCKDQAVLFLSLLKAAGIRAYPALLNVFPSAELNRKVPTPYFDHLIVYIPMKNGDLWLDTTSGVTEFPNLHWQDQNRWAFVINGKGGKFIKTPSSTPEDNQGVIRIASRFKDGTIKCKMIVEGKGAISDNIKSISRSIPAFQQENIISGLVKAIIPYALIQSIEFSDLQNPRQHFKAITIFELKDIWKEEMLSFSYTSNALPMLSFFAELNNMPSPENRKNDYIVCPFKYKLIQELFCNPPAKDFIPSVIHPEEIIDTRFIRFKTRYPREGNAIRAQSEFELKQNRVTNEEYKGFHDSIQETLKKSGWMVVFQKSRIDKKEKKLEAEVKKSPQDARALLKLARNYLTKAKYEEAMDLLERAVKLDPENGEIHYFLGVALSYLDKYDEGQKKFEMAKELGYEP